MVEAKAEAMKNNSKNHFKSQYNEGFTPSEALICMYLTTNLPIYK